MMMLMTVDLHYTIPTPQLGVAPTSLRQVFSASPVKSSKSKIHTLHSYSNTFRQVVCGRKVCLNETEEYHAGRVMPL